MNKAFRIIKYLIEFGFLLLCFGVTLYVTYYFGWMLLVKGPMSGNDIASAMNNIVYLEKWFPPIPQWSYLGSGGMPFLQIYPIAPFVLTFFLGKAMHFDVLQIFKFVCFMSLPLAATGVAALGRVLTKSWWVGLLAGVIMLISPDSWLWITYGGFYAVNFSVPFFAWSLVFFCLALEMKSFWWSLVAAIFYGVTWLAHPMSGMLGAVVMAFLGMGYGFKNYNWKLSWKSVLQTMGIGLLGIGIFAWWIVPFLTREDVGGISLGAEQMFRMTFLELAGLQLPESLIYNTSTFYALSAIILFIFGSVVVFFRRSILRWAVLACGLAVFIMTAPYYAQPIVKIFQLFWAATNVRSGLILRILGPVVGAYGAVSVVRPLFFAVEHFVKGLKEKSWWFYLTETVGGGVGIIIFLLLVFKGPIIIPPWQGEGDKSLAYSGYGPLRNWFLTVRKDGTLWAVLTDEKGKETIKPLYKNSQEIISDLTHLTSLVLKSEESYWDLVLRAMVEKSGVTEKDRIDFPPGWSIVGAIGNYSQVGTVQAYIGSSLIQPMIGWQIDCVFYNKLCGPKQIADIYKWFGVSQIWIGQGDIQNPTNYLARFYNQDFCKWEKLNLGSFSKEEESLNICRMPENTLASITNKPAILVIGDNPPNNDVFASVFKDLTKVDFGYQNAWSVKGKRFIDDYPLEELQKFEGIFLYGYQYHDKTKAWNLLDKYVSGGGNLFINSGWQYMSPDWGAVKNGVYQEYPLPNLFPVSKTTWGQIENGKWNLTLGSHQITQGLDTTDWGEPLWEEKYWGVAYAKKSDLRNGATSVLENNGKVLMAVMDHGKGKVAWTGFDFWGHLNIYQADSERQLVKNTLTWLLGNSGTETKLDFTRVRPELIKIKFTELSGENKLMFKEVADNHWSASATSQNGKKISLPIYKAGPGWKMVIIPSSLGSGTVTFSFHKNMIQIIGIIISAISICLVVFLIILKYKGKNFVQEVKQKISLIFSKKFKDIKNKWEDDTDA